MTDAEKAHPSQGSAYPLPEARWPNRDEARSSLLFSPLEHGPLRLRTRSWVPAMVPWRATDDGFVTERNIAWYERFARGLPGALVVEATGIRDVPSGPLLRIGHDRFIPGLRTLVDTVKKASGGRTRFLIQIIDFLQIRRRPAVDAYFGRFLTVDDDLRRRAAQATGDVAWLQAEEPKLRRFLEHGGDELHDRVLTGRELESLRWGFRERVTDLDKPHIRELPRVLPGLFAAAAERAQRAGFDGVELHFAHAYTMASFLSPLNTRDDGYGGTREGRVRLPLEVIQAVRQSVGTGFTVGARFLGDEVVTNGGRIEDATFYATAFAGAGLDFLSISKGGKFEDARRPLIGAAAYPYTGPSGHECMPTVRIGAPGPFGRNLGLSGAVRKAVRAAGFTTPVVGAGGIATFDLAEAALRRGDCDLVGAARQSLADPDWWLKMEEGRGAEVRRCEFTNYCEGLDQKHKEVTCRLWDKLPCAPGEAATLSLDGKRRLLPP